MNVLQRVNLKHAVKRYIHIPTEHKVGTNCITLTQYEKGNSDKPGLIKLVIPEPILVKDHLVLFSPHPDLYRFGEVSAPSILEPGTHHITVAVRPFFKDVDWADFEYLANLYVGSSILV